MRIGIDARVLDRTFTGTGRYLLNILLELPNQDIKNKYVLFTASDLGVDKVFYEIVKIKNTKIPLKLYSPIWLNYELPNLIKQNRIDLLFSPNIMVPLVNLGSTKKVAVLHDVIPKVFPEYYPFFYKLYLSTFLPLSLRKTDLLVTVSEYSKRDIVKYYGISMDKIRVVYNTASKYFNDNVSEGDLCEEQLQELNLPSDYLLYVGAVEKRKNITCLLNTIDTLKKSNNKLDLVIVGKEGYGADMIMSEIQKRTYIKHYSFLDDKLLRLVYYKAFAFIFPSYYEGFGIPPLEAMQTGIPVITSNTSSLVEVVGKNGLMNDPEDHNSFVKDVLSLQNNPVFYKKMQSLSLKQAEQFNIKDEVKKIIDIFNTVVKS